MVLKAKA
jgi:nucleotide-binding universal stress UspA family protein